MGLHGLTIGLQLFGGGKGGSGPAKAAKATTAAKATAKATTAATTPVAAPPDSLNAEYFKEVSDAIESIRTHWPGIAVEAALGIEEGGHIAPITRPVFEMRMKNAREAAGGLSLFAIDLLRSASPGIPINGRAVKHLSDQKFATPKRFPQIVLIGITDPTSNIFDHLGALLSATPLELLHAMIFAVARDIAKGSGLVEESEI